MQGKFWLVYEVTLLYKTVILYECGYLQRVIRSGAKKVEAFLDGR